jgi:hypothetical protein
MSNEVKQFIALLIVVSVLIIIAKLLSEGAVLS